MNEVLLISLCQTVTALIGSTVKNPKSRKKLTKPLAAVRDAINNFLAVDESE